MAVHDPSQDDDTAVLRPEFPVNESRRPAGRQWTLWEALRTFSMRNLIFAMILGVLAAAGGAAIGLNRPTEYSGTAVMIIDQPRLLANSTDEGPIRKLALLRLKYAELADTPAITGPAATQLGLTEREVRDRVTAVADAQTLLLKINATDPARAGADKTANTVAQAVATYADQEQARQGIPQTDRFKFTVVQPASLAARTQPSTSRALQAAFALGIIGFGLAYVVLQLITAPVRLG